MDQIYYKNILNCFNYTSIYFNGLYFLITILVIYLYSKDKRIGIIVSTLLLFVLCFVPYTIGYLPLIMLKLMLIVFGSFLLFFSLNFKCIQDIVNNILTTCVRLNFFVLIFSIKNIFLMVSMLFITITTPIFTVQNETVKMENMIISKNLWVLLSTIVLIIYYILTPWFCHNVTLVILAVLIPCFMHFFHNKFLESRALSLCIFIIFDIFNNSKKNINKFIEDSKY
jgi:hypothetical protein